MSNATHTNRTRNAGRVTLHTPATARKASAPLGSVAEDWHSAMIAEAAYNVAQRRGCKCGREFENWLLTESQLEAAIRGGDSPP